MKKTEYTISIFTENQVGLLTRIATMFSRRKINVESLNVSPSEVEGIHRFTVVINETEDTVQKICRQIQKQIEVIKVYSNTNEDIVWQELALYKLPTDIVSEKLFVERLLRKHGANVVCVRKDYTVFAVTGHDEEIRSLVCEMEPYGLIEFIRSGRVAIIKNSEGFHKKLSEFEYREPADITRENEVLDQKHDIFTM